ncbi:hypothetical protein Bca4012_011264 [Brassica carinata]
MSTPNSQIEQTQDEEEQPVEADAELGDVDKERETSKVNEGQTLEKEEEEQMEADAGLEDPLYKTQDDEEPQVGADGEFNEGQTLEKEEEEEQMEADSGLEDHLYKEQTQDDEEPQVGTDGEFNEGQTLEKEEDKQMEADAGLEDPLYKTQDDEEPHVGAEGEFNEGQTLEKEEEEQMEADSALEDHLYKEQTQDDEEPQVGVDGEFNEGQTLEEEEDKQIEADAGLEDPVVVERQEERRGNKEQTQDDEEPHVGADGEFNEGKTLEEEKEQMEADARLEYPVVVERQKEERRNKEQKKSGEKRKDEAHEKDKEKNQDEDVSMTNSEKLDKLLQMVYDLGKRVEVIQNVLGVKVPDGSSNKQDYEKSANFFDDTKGAPNDENEEEANPGDKRNAADDGNDEEIIDKEAISATQQLTEVNTIGENEITEKITQDEETEKMENESFKKQKSQVTSSSQTFTTPNFDTRVTSPTPTYTTPKFDLLSQESRSSVKCATEVLMRDVGEKSEFQPLMKTKKRSVQQDNQVNDDAELPVKKKNKEKNISVLYSAIEIEEKYWLGIVVNLEKRSVTAFNSAAVKFTDANIRAYVNAYAIVLPFMLRNIFKDVNVDTSKFDIYVVSEDYPQNQVIMDGSKKMMKRPMQDVYGSDASEGFNKGKKETTEHYRALLRLSNEHRKSEVAWTEASGTVNSLADQIELLNAIIESEGKFDLVAELEKLTLEHDKAEDIRGGIKVKIPDWDKLDEKWLLEE